MGKKSQRKGAVGELELARLLRAEGFEIERGGMSFGTVPDLVGLPGIHIEVKRTERLQLSDAMAQAVRDAAEFDDGLPAVFHRKNREGWIVSMRLEDWLNVYKGLDLSPVVATLSWDRAGVWTVDSPALSRTGDPSTTGNPAPTAGRE